jgi:hypothetical protein
VKSPTAFLCDIVVKVMKGKPIEDEELDFCINDCIYKNRYDGLFDIARYNRIYHNLTPKQLDKLNSAILMYKMGVK